MFSNMSWTFLERVKSERISVDYDYYDRMNMMDKGN